jgi:hypothetical protein
MFTWRMLIQLLLCTGAATLSGCSGLGQVQDSLSKFDDGAHAVAAAQMRFLDNAHSIGCERQFYKTANAFASAGSAPLDLRGRCTAAGNIISSAQVHTRQRLFDAITLYADQLQALGTGGDGDDDKALTKNMQSAAVNLNRLASGHALTAADPSLPGQVEQAVATLTGMVIDHRRFSDIRSAAQSQQGNLALVVDTVKMENLLLATGVDSAIGAIRADMTTALSASRDRQGPAVFSDVVQARTYLQAMQAYDQRGLDDSIAAADPALDPDTQVGRLNRALDCLLAANDAIARAGTGGIHAAVSDLVARAQAAQAFKAALSQ